MSCSALIYIQNSKKNKNKNKNKLSIEIEKTESKQIVFESVADLNKTSSRNFFAEFYDSATKFLCNSELPTESSDKNIISFYFIFARASLTNISIEDKKRENIYKQRKRVCGENNKDRAKQIFCSLIFSREHKCFE